MAKTQTKPWLVGFLVLFHSFAFGASDYVPGEVIVKLRPRAKSQQAYAFLGRNASERAMVLKRQWSKLNIYQFQVRPGQSVEEAVGELSQDPNVEYAEPNSLVFKSDDTGLQKTFSAGDVQQLSASGVDPMTAAPINATATWADMANYVPTSAPPIVAVVDTGLDTTHPVFANSHAVFINPGEIPANGIDDDQNGLIDDVNGWNFVNDTGAVFDDEGHGTHVSGIILGAGQNIFSPPFPQAKIRILPLKFLNSNGVGSTSDAISAIYYAAQMGASVINNSWGGSVYSQALGEAIAYTYQKGIAFVVAAGNAGSNNDSAPTYPANYNVPNIISVAATTDLDYLASFSNFGARTVALASPGVFILSSIPNGYYGTSSGTSMAAPFVSGIAALMKVKSPDMLGYQIKQIVMNQADSISQLNSLVNTNGRVNSLRAVNYAAAASVDAYQPPYTYSGGAGSADLSSSLATGGAGGCGLVKSTLSGGEGPSSGPWTVGLIVGLLFAPLAYWMWARTRQPAARRRHERFQVDSEVRVRMGDRELIGSVSSISLGGVQLNTDVLLENGGIVGMTIQSPDGKDFIQVEGKIVWSEAQKSYGVAFSNAPLSALERISLWTKALKKSA